MNGIYLYFVHKHLSSWPLLGLQHFPKRQILDSLKFDENERKFSKWIETLREREKLLPTSNFSFPQSVFKRLVQQTRKTHGLFEKLLNLIYLQIHVHG